MRLFPCKDIESHLNHSTLQDTAPESLKQHLEECDGCRQAWETRFNADRLIVSLVEDDPAPAPSLVGRRLLSRRLEEELRESSRPERTIPSAAPVSARRAAWTAVGVALPATLVLLARILPLTPAGHTDRTAGRPSAIGPIASAPETLSPGPNPPSAAITPHSTEQPPSASPSLGSVGQARASRPSPKPESIPPATPPGAGRREGTDDLAYINAESPARQPGFEARGSRTPALRGDDFITIPLPRLASAAIDTPESQRTIAEAIQGYEQEKAVVDERLFQKIDVEMKGGDLKTLAGLLARKSGVKFYVSPDLEDLKLTVLVKQLPVRDLMRQVVRLFNLQWHRRGEEGHYTYQLVQDLKQKLAEEELKRQDQDQMLLNVVSGMDPYLAYKDASPDELKSMADDAKTKAATAGTVEERNQWLEQQQVFSNLARPDWKGVLSLFSQLTPDQLVSLQNGGEIDFNYKTGNPENTLPQDSAQSIFDDYSKKFDLLNWTSMDGLNFKIGFRLDRRLPDQVSLDIVDQAVDDQRRGVGLRDPIMTGQPDRLKDPGNTAAHASLQSDPNYRQPVDLSPASSSEALDGDHPMAEEMLNDLQKQPGSGDAPLDRRDWVDSADLFADLHRQTGRNMIADYYTRVYPKSMFSFKGKKLLATLNTIGDALQSEWVEDGGIIRFRRFNYYTERTLDVPNRLLNRWKTDRERRGYLDLDDLSEIAALPEPTLEHAGLRKAVLVKYGLDEWSLASRSGRNAMLLYAALTPEQRQAAQSDDGLAIGSLKPETIDLLRHIGSDTLNALSPDQMYQVRIVYRYSKPGNYNWLDWSEDPAPSFPISTSVMESTREKAEAGVEAYLRQKGSSPDKIAQAQKNIYGPGGMFLFQARAGEKYYLVNYMDQGSMRDKDGTVANDTPEAASAPKVGAP